MMTKGTIGVVVLFLCMLPTVSLSMDHGSEHGSHDHTGMMSTGVMAHEQVIDGVKAVFKVTDIKESMHGAVPKGLKETHHVMAQFTSVASGKTLAAGEVRIKVQGPDGSEQIKDLIAMEGHFGADFDLSKKGDYGMMVKFKLSNDKARSTQFWYKVK